MPSGGARKGAGRPRLNPGDKPNMSQFTAQIPTDVKEEATKILKDMGMTTTQVVNMLFRQIIRDNGVPLSMQITENGLTLKEEDEILLSKKKLSKAMSKDEFLEHLETL